MSDGATDAQWKHKYRELIDELERKETQWSDVESLLRKSISRVSIAATHLDARLDQPLKAIRTAVGSKLDARRLEAGLDGLSRAIESLEPSAEGDAQPIAQELTKVLGALPTERDLATEFERHLERIGGNDLEAILAALGEQLSSLVDDTPGTAPGQIEATLVQLLNHVAESSGRSELLSALQTELEQGLNADNCESVLEGAVELVSGAISALRTQRLELSALFDHVAAQLDYFYSFVEHSGSDLAASLRNRETLEREVHAGVADIRETVRNESDVDAIRSRITSQLDGIGNEMARFRELETKRAAGAEARNSELAKRVRDLEFEASSLRQRCEDQQAKLVLDPLTQVHSRYAYDGRLAEEFDRWKRYQNPLAYAIWDVDYFKRVNDSFGHKAGDRALQRLAQIVREQMRESDFLARIGGEEFVVLFPDTDKAQALNAMESIRARVGQTKFKYNGKPVVLSISCGITDFQSSDDPERVYERADKALYQAKQSGRNQCVSL